MMRIFCPKQSRPQVLLQILRPCPNVVCFLPQVWAAKVWRQCPSPPDQTQGPLQEQTFTRCVSKAWSIPPSSDCSHPPAAAALPEAAITKWRCLCLYLHLLTSLAALVNETLDKEVRITRYQRGTRQWGRRRRRIEGRINLQLTAEMERGGETAGKMRR